MRGGVGKELLTLIACEQVLPPGTVLPGKEVRQGGRVTVMGAPADLVKKTLEIETR